MAITAIVLVFDGFDLAVYGTVVSTLLFLLPLALAKLPESPAWLPCAPAAGAALMRGRGG